jgi:hypothetical protein
LRIHLLRVRGLVLTGAGVDRRRGHGTRRSASRRVSLRSTERVVVRRLIGVLV